jgi:AcrR family transcriptional regulator
MISRQRLLEAAARVFAESGFRGATTRRIAEAAGVNEVTLFRLFGSKQQLLCEAMTCLQAEEPRGLPEHPQDVEGEMVAWAESHLEMMRGMRHVIRRTMAEIEEHPEMTPIVTEAKTPVHQNLVAYANKVWMPRTNAEREHVRLACTMLGSALFSDALGRDVVPTAYPAAASTAARKYVRMFLTMLGAPRLQNKRATATAAAR